MHARHVFERKHMRESTVGFCTAGFSEIGSIFDYMTQGHDEVIGCNQFLLTVDVQVLDLENSGGIEEKHVFSEIVYVEMANKTRVGLQGIHQPFLLIGFTNNFIGPIIQNQDMRGVFCQKPKVLTQPSWTPFTVGVKAGFTQVDSQVQRHIEHAEESALDPCKMALAEFKGGQSTNILSSAIMGSLSSKQWDPGRRLELYPVLELLAHEQTGNTSNWLSSSNEINVELQNLRLQGLEINTLKWRHAHLFSSVWEIEFCDKYMWIIHKTSLCNFGENHKDLKVVYQDTMPSQKGNCNLTSAQLLRALTIILRSVKLGIISVAILDFKPWDPGGGLVVTITVLDIGEKPVTARQENEGRESVQLGGFSAITSGSNFFYCTRNPSADPEFEDTSVEVCWNVRSCSYFPAHFDDSLQLFLLKMYTKGLRRSLRLVLRMAAEFSLHEKGEANEYMLMVVQIWRQQHVCYRWFSCQLFLQHWDLGRINFRSSREMVINTNKAWMICFMQWDPG